MCGAFSPSVLLLVFFFSSFFYCEHFLNIPQIDLNIPGKVKKRKKTTAQFGNLKEFSSVLFADYRTFKKVLNRIAPKLLSLPTIFNIPFHPTIEQPFSLSHSFTHSFYQTFSLFLPFDLLWPKRVFQTSQTSKKKRLNEREKKAKKIK